MLKMSWKDKRQTKAEQLSIKLAATNLGNHIKIF